MNSTRTDLKLPKIRIASTNKTSGDIKLRLAPREMPELHHNNDTFTEAINKVFTLIESNTKDIDPDYVRVVDENFWDLIDNDIRTY